MRKNFDVAGVMIPVPTPTCEHKAQGRRVMRFDISLASHIDKIADRPKAFCDKLVSLLSQHYASTGHQVEVLKSQLRGNQILFVELACGV